MGPELKTPIVAAHLYMLEPGPSKDNWDEVPEDHWNNIRFDLVDVLYVSPFQVRIDNGKVIGDFVLDNPAERGDGHANGTLENRLRWLVKKARGMNSNIKILAQQWWNGHDYEDLASDELQKKYALSVRTIIKQYDLDGYELDYEWRDGKGPGDSGNVMYYAPKILQMIHEDFKSLSSEMNKHLYVTVSPATSLCLNGKSANGRATLDSPIPSITNCVDFFNIQNYSGGDPEVENYTGGDLKIPCKQILLGLWPESTGYDGKTSPSIKGLIQDYTRSQGEKNTNDKFAGVHVWRLNSHNQGFENRALAYVFDRVKQRDGPSGVGGYDHVEVEASYESHYWDFIYMWALKETDDPNGYLCDVTKLPKRPTGYNSTANTDKYDDWLSQFQRMHYHWDNNKDLRG